MGTKVKFGLLKLANWMGRKMIALMIMIPAVLAAGIFAPDKVGSISIALVSLYGAFVGGHSATDIMTRDKTTTAVTKTEVKVTDAKAKSPETEEAD